MSVKEKKKSHAKWVLVVFILTFILSTTFSFLSTEAMEKISLPFAIVMLFIIILIGVLMDLVSVAVTAADIDSLHAKASDKKKGAKTAIKLVKHADKVASICADVIGDICGILTGSVGVLVAIEIANRYNFQLPIVTLIVGGIIAALTVTGKAIEKQMSIDKANEIVYIVGKILEFYKK